MVVWAIASSLASPIGNEAQKLSARRAAAKRAASHVLVRKLQNRQSPRQEPADAPIQLFTLQRESTQSSADVLAAKVRFVLKE